MEPIVKTQQIFWFARLSISRGILIWLATEGLTLGRYFLCSLEFPSLSVKIRRQEILPFRLKELYTGLNSHRTLSIL